MGRDMKKNILFTFLISQCVFGNNVPSDLLFSKQWYLRNTGQVITKNVSELERSFVKGSVGVDIGWVNPSELKINSENEVIVAVIDSGIDLKHPDLKDRIWFNSKLCKDLTNVKNQPCHGWNFINNTNDLKDDLGHGTHVAGIVAANGNTIGIQGIAPKNVKIMPLKVVDSGVTGFVVNGKIFTDLVAEAMTFAIKNGASVINLSMGWPKVIDTPKVRLAFRQAEQNGVLVIAASGNNNKDLPTFPCSYDNVLCVGATDNNGKLAEFSNHGPKIDLVAPGEFIISTIPEGLESRLLRIKGYDSKRGSSQASPIIAAIAATLKAVRPSLMANDLKTILFSSAEKLNESQKKVLFGSANMRQAWKLIDQELSIIQPLNKEATEVRVNNSGTVEFKTKFKKILANQKVESGKEENDEEKIEVCLKGTVDLLVENPCRLINIAANKVLEIDFTLKLNNFQADSHQDVALVITRANGKSQVFPQTLILSRDFLAIENQKKIAVTETSNNDLLATSNERLVARLQSVLRAEGASSAFFGVEKNAQIENASVYTVFKHDVMNETIMKTRFQLPKLSRLITVHERDFNFDGNLDYLFYGLNEKKDKLVFGFFNQRGSPLYLGHHIWNLELSTFEGLPVDGNREMFSWLKIENSFLGDILVPSFLRNYSTPEKDNSKNILDRMLGARPHLFYLDPKAINNEVQVELRVLDSFSVRNQIIGKISEVEDPELILINRELTQTEADKRAGRFSALISLQTQSLGKVFQLKINKVQNGKVDFDLVALNSQVPGIAQSVVLPVLGEENSVLPELMLTALLNRTNTRNLFFDKDENSERETLYFKSKSYDDPVINLTGAFSDSDQTRHLLVENRYSINLVTQSLAGPIVARELPVYRDSSFPGVNFSETLTAFRSNGAPSLFVNSTLIFGDRLYMATLIDGKFLRPVGTSIAIPKSCANLGLQMENNKAHLAMLCLEKDNRLSMVFSPLIIE